MSTHKNQFKRLEKLDEEFKKTKEEKARQNGIRKHNVSKSKEETSFKTSNSIGSKDFSIFFRPEEKYLKQKYIQAEINFLNANLLENHSENMEEIKNHSVILNSCPELVEIDYSFIKDKHVPKFGGRLYEYKDGLLLINPEKKIKSFQRIMIEDYTSESVFEKDSGAFSFCSFGTELSYFIDPDQVKKYLNKDLNLYIVFSKYYKNKAYKLSFKDNIYLKTLYELTKSSIKNFLYPVLKEKEEKIFDYIIERNGFDSLTDNYETYISSNKEDGKFLLEDIENLDKKTVVKCGFAVD